MADRPSPNRLMILWSIPEEYAAVVSGSRQSVYLSVRLESEVALPADPPPGPPPSAEEVPRMESTQAAYEVFQGIDNLLGEADEFIARAPSKPDLTRSEGAPLRIEYEVTLRQELADRGVPLAFAVGWVDTLDRGALLPRFLVTGDDRRAGETRVDERREGGPGAVFAVSMLEYLALLDDLRAILSTWKDAAAFPLPDGWFVGTRLHALLTSRILAHPAVTAALGGGR